MCPGVCPNKGTAPPDVANRQSVGMIYGAPAHPGWKQSLAILIRLIVRENSTMDDVPKDYTITIDQAKFYELVKIRSKPKSNRLDMG